VYYVLLYSRSKSVVQRWTQRRLIICVASQDDNDSSDYDDDIDYDNIDDDNIDDDAV